MSRSLLLSCEAVSKSYGARSLFEALSFGLFEGDQAGLIGPNGAGKSTLLKILAGIETPDRGTRSVRSAVRIGYVAQDPVFTTDGTVTEVIAETLAGVDDDERPGRIAETLSRGGFAGGHADLGTLSGGSQKRLAIACALGLRPDVLLLDEPTNHLDVDGILWLEALLTDQARACLVISHDRYFLEHVTTRTLELNRIYPGGLFETDGRYSDFLVRREDFLRAQAAYEQSLANTVRREIEWLRRGAKARSTKAKGRIEAAGRLIEELGDARARGVTGTVGIDFTSSDRRARKLLTARGLGMSLGGRRLIDGLDVTITPGTHVGVIGPNGSGKTTLLNLLAGTLAPDDGAIERAADLRVVRFDQDRRTLDPSEPLRRALAPEGDAIVFQGRSLHVAAWAKRFLFQPEQLEVPVGRLSGGEQARILIAQLMRAPADLLILDEPTNDLDIPTLEVLEDSLAEFAGGLVLVTHDRFMLDRVSTMILALDGQGGAEIFADYAQWEATRARRTAMRQTIVSDERRAAAAPRERTRARRLGYHEQREWDGMEGAILGAEERLARCQRAVEDPTIAADAAALQERYAALEAARADVDRLYARWAELEAKQA